jgi:AraC family transcriptional regulator
MGGAGPWRENSYLPFMNRSERGFFYGDTTEKIRLEGVTLTDTIYGRHGRVDWHFHEDDYFTFLLVGGMCEGNRKEIYECVAGDLLFHNWQDAHYNIGSGRFTRGFHVELSDHWYEKLGISAELTEGSLRLADPLVKSLMYQVFKEAKLSGERAQLGVDAALARLFGILGKMREAQNKTGRPAWVGRVREMLRDGAEDWTLVRLAQEAGIHPVHLSREFSRHFHTHLGDYLRLVKVQRAMTLLGEPERLLTGIAFECGFADQSHFIRSFRAYYGVTPLEYRRLMVGGMDRGGRGSGC